MRKPKFNRVPDRVILKGEALWDLLQKVEEADRVAIKLNGERDQLCVAISNLECQLKESNERNTQLKLLACQLEDSNRHKSEEIAQLKLRIAELESAWE